MNICSEAYKHNEIYYMYVMDTFSLNLFSAGKEKLSIEEDCSITIVIEEDGTEIDQAYFDVLNPQTFLMVLQEGEMWIPSPSE